MRGDGSPSIVTGCCEWHYPGVPLSLAPSNQRDVAAPVTDHEPASPASSGARDTAAGSLRALFTPHSVAVTGASATPEKQGNVAIRYLKQAGFAGRIYPVNPLLITDDGVIAVDAMIVPRAVA